jgi:hypothetical protein
MKNFCVSLVLGELSGETTEVIANLNDSTLSSQDPRSVNLMQAAGLQVQQECIQLMQDRRNANIQRGTSIEMKTKGDLMCRKLIQTISLQTGS